MKSFLHTVKYHVEVYLLRRRTPKLRPPASSDAAKTPQVSILKDVSLCGESGFVFDRRGLLYDVSAPVNARSKIRRPVRTMATKHLSGRVFHLAGECSWNRAHFMLEHGVRLMIAHESGEISSCDSLLVHRKPANWLSDYLAFFVGGAEKLPQLTTEKYTVRCDELVFVPGPSGDLLRFPRDVYQRYGDYLRGGVTKKLGTLELGQHAVWISRADAPERSCHNVSELQRIFTEVTSRDVREVLLTGMTLEEQIRQLSSTTIIVAEEGQALNLLPFVSGKQVLILDKGEQSAQSRWNKGFQQIAEAVGNEVHCLFSELDSSVLQWEYPALKFRGEIEALAVLKR